MSNTIKQLKDAQGNLIDPKTSIDALTTTGGGGKFLTTKHINGETKIVDTEISVDSVFRTVTVGTTTTGEPDAPAEVTNSGTGADAVLDFVIPKGNAGHNPNLGTFRLVDGAITPTPPTPTEDGDYITVLDETDPDNVTGTIYKWNSSNNRWETTGRDANMAYFGGGELLIDTYIDDTGLANPREGSLSKAEDVMQLNAKLEGVTASETKVQLITSGEGQNVYDGYIDGSTGEYTQSSYNKFIVIPLNGAKSVRWLGKENASNTSYLGWAFGTFGGEIDSTLSTFTALSKGVYANNPLDNQAVEYVKDAIEGATHAVITIWIYKSGGGSAVTMDNFYCYLQSGNSVGDYLYTTKKTRIDDNYGMMKKRGLIPGTNPKKWSVPNNGKHIEVSAKAGEKYLVVNKSQTLQGIVALCKNAVPQTGSAQIDVDFVDGTGLIRPAIGESVEIIIPSDCYLCVTTYVTAGSTAYYPCELYRIETYTAFEYIDEKEIGSGERLDDIYIDDTSLVNANENSVAKAFDAMQVKSSLGINVTETKIIAVEGQDGNVHEGYVVGEDGTISNTSNYKYMEVEIPQGTYFFRMFVFSPKSSSAWRLGYAFGNYVSSEWVTSSSSRFEENGLANGTKEVVIPVDRNATHFRVTCQVTYSGNTYIDLDNFYCYAQHGVSIAKMLENAGDVIKTTNRVVTYIDEDRFLLHNYYINASGNWVDTYSHYIVEIPEGTQKIRLVASKNSSVTYALFKTYTYEEGNPPTVTYPTGWGTAKRKKLGANKSVEFAVSDAAYLYLGNLKGSSYFVSIDDTIEITEKIVVGGFKDQSARIISTQDNILQGNSVINLPRVFDANRNELANSKQMSVLLQRADKMLNFKWTPKESGKIRKSYKPNETTVFWDAEEQTGIPYSGNCGVSVGFGVSLYTFKTAVDNKYSLMYCENLQASEQSSVWNSNFDSATYGTVRHEPINDHTNCWYGTYCNGFAAVCTGLEVPISCGAYGVMSKYFHITSPVYNEFVDIRIGDVFSSGPAIHTRLVTGVETDENGNVTYVTITEAAGNDYKVVKSRVAVNNDNPNNYWKGIIEKYRQYRVNDLYKNLQLGEMLEFDENEYTELTEVCTFAGDKVTFLKGDMVVINYCLDGTSVSDFIASKPYLILEKYNDNEEKWEVVGDAVSINNIDTSIYPSYAQYNSWVIPQNKLDGGSYRCYAHNSSEHQAENPNATYFDVVDNNFEINGNMDSFIVQYNGNGKICGYNFGLTEGSGYYIPLSDEEKAGNYIELHPVTMYNTLNSSYNGSFNFFVKVYIKGEYGIVRSKRINITTNL